MQVQFSLPINDDTVNPNNFGILSGSIGRSAHSFETGVVPNDEFITINFQAKSSVSEVTFSKGTLKGMNGVLVESQSITTFQE